MQYYDIRPAVLRGEKDTGHVLPYHPSMGNVVESCPGEFPVLYHPNRDGWWGLSMVSAKSSKSYRSAIEKLGVYFKREMNYDFRPFKADEFSGRHLLPRRRSTDENTRAFFWFHGYPEEWMTFGGCCFRRRKLRIEDEVRSVWYLMWVWMHPYARRNGHLARYWGFFKSMFGSDFGMELPLSPAMEKFVTKQDHKPANILM